MISKILITLGVIVVCMMMLSSRGKPKQKLKTIPNPEVERNRKLMRNLAFAFMGIMAIAASFMIYLEVGKNQAIVTVRVINTQSGESKSYRVMRNDIHNDGFTTTDGVEVFVAGVNKVLSKEM